MKLRISENSLRLRLSDEEIVKLIDKGNITETLNFPGVDNQLIYSLSISDTLETRLKNNHLQIMIPFHQVKSLMQSQHIGIEHKISTGESHLHLTIEKDLHKSPKITKS